MKAFLVLSNGAVFTGTLRGARKATSGEVIFNTSMTGYQEILTDPSYQGQMVTMTYPHIGNYGIAPEDMESRKVFASGMIVRELTEVPSNFRSTQSLDAFLAEQGVTLIEGLDTRALVTILREAGSLPGLIHPDDGTSLDELKRRAAALPTMEGQNMAAVVSDTAPYRWENREKTANPKPYKVVAYDYGIKYGILRQMAAAGMDVEVVPWNTPAADVLAKKPHGVFLSNGPGDPEAVDAAIANVKALLGQVPLFGICLGHQILALALGGHTYKLKYGHHGGNHPVMDLGTRKIEITAQNHGFAVDATRLPAGVEVTHTSLNDQTVEGISVPARKAFSVQYHPEACPGPHDSAYLFGRFIELMDANK